MLQGPAEAVLASDLWLPAQQRAGTSDVGPPHARVVLRQRLVDDRALAAGQLQNFLGKIENAQFVRIAEVDRLVEVGKEQAIDALDEVADEAEAARLRAVAVDRQRLAAQ